MTNGLKALLVALFFFNTISSKPAQFSFAWNIRKNFIFNWLLICNIFYYFKFSKCKKLLFLCFFCQQAICRCGNKPFYVQFRRIRSVHFLSKNGMDAACETVNGRGGLQFSPDLVILLRYVLTTSIFLFLVSLLTQRVNKYVSRQEKGT